MVGDEREFYVLEIRDDESEWRRFSASDDSEDLIDSFEWFADHHWNVRIVRRVEFDVMEHVHSPLQGERGSVDAGS